MAAVGDFLGYVHVREPDVGLALDYVLTAGITAGRLILALPDFSPILDRVLPAGQRLEDLAAHFFAAPTAVAVETREVTGELKIFPVEASKSWNDVVCLLPHGGDCSGRDAGDHWSALCIRKPDYRRLAALAAVRAELTELRAAVAGADAAWLGNGSFEEVVLAAVRRAQEKRGYAHFVTLLAAAPGFRDLACRLMRVKEFGLPGCGPFVARAVLGRLHAVFPGQFHAGLTLVHRLAEGQ
ncbi:MAG: hypothetical protein JW781_08465 [Deltaproteobacteria bacterium]|nr:hypothetical protein [Candidatus Anaeroferrophillacea bacterium]